MVSQGAFKTPDDRWTMDLFFVENINVCIREFATGLFRDDLESMKNSIDFLAIIIVPETYDDKDFSIKLDEDLKWVDANIKQIQIHSDGEVVGYNHQNKKAVVDKMKIILGYMLIKLEKLGIYTRIKKDPRMTMGRFGSS